MSTEHGDGLDAAARLGGVRMNRPQPFGDPPARGVWLPVEQAEAVARQVDAAGGSGRGARDEADDASGPSALKDIPSWTLFRFALVETYPDPLASLSPSGLLRAAEAELARCDEGEGWSAELRDACRAVVATFNAEPAARVTEPTIVAYAREEDGGNWAAHLSDGREIAGPRPSCDTCSYARHLEGGKA